MDADPATAVEPGVEARPALRGTTGSRRPAGGGRPGRPDDTVELNIRRADVLCLGPIIVLTLWNLGMTPFAPGLLSHPVLLDFIRGSSSAMLAAGAAARTGAAPLWLVLIAPIPILMAADPFLYWAGRRYGRRIVDFLAENDPRWRRRMARSERWFQRFGPWAIAFGYYIPFVPAALFYLAAGESRMRIRTFILADLAGTLTWIGIHIGVGYAAGSTAKHIADTIAKYGLWAAIAIIAGAIVWTVYTQLRKPLPEAAVELDIDAGIDAEEPTSSS